MTKQRWLKWTMWLMTSLYLLSLFLPYRITNGKSIDTGLDFTFPIAGLIFIIPYILISYLYKTKIGLKITIALTGMYFIFCFMTFCAVSFSFFEQAETGTGAYLLLLVAIGFVIHSVVQFTLPPKSIHREEILDQLP